MRIKTDQMNYELTDQGAIMIYIFFSLFEKRKI